jgi:carboxyl-terminal processing protease
MHYRLKLMPMFVLLALLAIVQFSIAFTSNAPSYEWFDPLIDVRGVLVERHLIVPDEEAMQEAAILAMIETLDDPYALFIPDEKEKAFIKDLEGDYAGIGSEVRMIDGELHIITPMENSPSLAAGIKAGDVVELIDGEPATNETIEELIQRLTGPVGTDVVVFVRHIDGEKEEISITRGHIRSQSVMGLIRRDTKWSWCLDEDQSIAYVRIRQFNETTPQELVDALKDAEGEDLLKGLVIDLRENPGGALSAAIAISDMLLERGTIVTVRGRENPQRSFEAHPNHVLHGVPILILVNNNSASASEIVAGSLQANNRAAILGTRTFGKGSVQEVLELASGGMLKFTTARYDLAGGRTIDKRLSEDTGLWGVDPNEGLVVRETIQEQRLRRESREPFIIITDNEPDPYTCGDLEWIEETLNDHQLAQALTAMRDKLATGRWPTLTNDDPVVVGIQAESSSLAKERIEIIKALIDVESRLTSLQVELDEEKASLIPPEVDLENAIVTLTDQKGNEIGTWRVKHGNIEAALESLQLELESDTEE